jgi:hypothetical protein
MSPLSCVACPGCDPNFPWGCHPKKTPASRIGPVEYRCILTAKELQDKIFDAELKSYERGLRDGNDHAGK